MILQHHKSDRSDDTMGPTNHRSSSIVGCNLNNMSERVVFEKLEAAKTTKSFVLNGQRLTDVPYVVLEDEWCQQHLRSLYLKNNLICRVVSI